MICAGFDGREGGRDAAALARALGGGESVPLGVVAAVPFPPGSFGDGDEESAARAKTYDEVCARLRARGEEAIREQLDAGVLAGVEYERRVVLDDSPARALMTVAESEQPEALVLGSTSRGPLGRVLAGTIPGKLLAGGPCAVAVAPRGYADAGPGPPETVAAAFDGSEESRRALAAAAAIAVRVDASLLVIAVVGAQGALAYEREIAHEASRVLRGEGLDDARGEALRAEAEGALGELGGGPGAGVEVLHGDPAKRLVERTESGVDLLVLGSRGYGPLRRTFLGSVSTGVLQHAACPTLVVPR